MDKGAKVITDCLAKADRYIANKEYSQAKKCINKIIKKEPSNQQAFLKLAEVYFKMSLVDKANIVLKKILQLNPLNADAIELLAIANLVGNNFSKAESLFKDLLKVNPLHGYYGLASSSARKGDLVSANQYSREAVNKIPLNIPADLNKPIVLVLQSIGKNSFELGDAGYQLDIASNNMYSYVSDDITIVSLFVEQYENNSEILQKLPCIDLIYNAVADYDDCAQVLDMVNAIIKKIAKPVINPPLEQDLTSRDNNFARLHDIDGIVFPVTLKINLQHTDDQALQSLMIENQMKFPVLVRETGTHAGKTFEKIESSEEFISYRNRTRCGEAYLSQYYDIGREGIHRRFRVYCIKGVLCASAVYYGKNWNVHRKSNIKVINADYLQDEKKFYTNFSEFIRPYHSAITEIIKRTPLEYYGIDFDILDNKKIIVFEVNAAMNVSHGDDISKKMLTDAIVSLFEMKLNHKLSVN